jgi:hypothetical protein
MPVMNAISAARLAVVEAKAASTLGLNAVAAAARLGTEQASQAYQLAKQILQNKAVDLAPALILLEVAAINEGVAAYLAEETAAAATEREVAAKAQAAFEDVKAKYDAQARGESSVYLNNLRMTGNTVYSPDDMRAAAAGDVEGAVRRSLDAANAASASAVGIALGQSN